MRQLVFALTLVSLLHSAQASPLLGSLERGPHPVGFQVWERYDQSRPFRYPYDLNGNPRPGVARPIQIGIWYPAASGEGKPMLLRDYVDLMGSEQDFTLPAAERRRRAEQAFFAIDILRQASPEARRGLLELTTSALRDAKPAAGKFPLILWSLGSPALYQASAEYLASHGYVVAIAPRLPDMVSLVDTAQNRTDYETKSRDMAFVISEMSRFPSADLGRIGVTGFSAGGRWAAAEAMRNPAVRAMVSLDSILLFGDENAEFGGMPFVHPSRMRIPVLHMIRRDWVPRERSNLWEEMRFADRTTWIFEERKLDHWDFASIGHAAAVAGLRGDEARAAMETFPLIQRATLRFFDAHLKGKGAPVSPAELPDGQVVSSQKPAERAFMVEAQFRELSVEDIDRSVALYRGARTESGAPPLPEATLNQMGYELLALNRAADAIKLFMLNAESFPQSANVHDSLSDAYLAAGDRPRALQNARKALELLPSDRSTPERKALIEQSARTKIQQLEAAGRTNS